MASDRLRAEHPRRAGVGDALHLMFPFADADREEQAERRLVHRIELLERLK